MPTQLVVAPATTQVRIVVNKGEDFLLTFPVYDATNALVSLATGWTAIAQVYPVGGGTLLYEWSAAKANLTCTSAGVVLQFIAAQTGLWTWQDAQFECDATGPVGRAIAAQGPFSALTRLVQP